MEVNKPTDQAGMSQQHSRAGRNPADNLTQEDRVRGGQRSASTQVRGPKGQFAGSVRRMGSDATPSSQDSGNDQGNGQNR